MSALWHLHGGPHSTCPSAHSPAPHVLKAASWPSRPPLSTPLQNITADSMLSSTLASGSSGYVKQQLAGQGTNRRVTCMAHPRRMAKVSKQIEREIGSLFLCDEKLQRAVHPDRHSLQHDDIFPPITSVTEVRVSSDLSVAKVYVSVYGDEEEQTATLEKLSRLQGYVRKHIGSAMSLRMTPEIRFMKDEFIQRGEQVLAGLDQVRLQREGKISPPPIAISRNVRAAVDRARDEGAESPSLAQSSSSIDADEDEEGDLDSLLEEDDSDAEDDAAGIDLDQFFQHEKQVAMAQQKQQRPARSRRR